MTRLPCVDFACHFSSNTKTFHGAKGALHKPIHLMLAALTVGFGLAVSCNHASAQTAKGSPDHIRAVTSAVDSASVKANTATSKDWPTIGLDYAETRYSKLNQINTDNVKNLGLVWSYSLDSSRGVEATPVVVDGIMYQTASWSVVHAIDARTGKKIWSVNTKIAFEAAKGFFGLACSPLVEGNAVLLNLGGVNGAGIVAFDKATGKLLWKATDDEASYSSPVAATLHDRRYAFFFTRSKLVALDPVTGKVLFEFPWRPRAHASVSAATPLVIGDLIFLSASYETGAVLLRVNDSKVEKVWSGEGVLSNHYDTSICHEGFLYGFDGRQELGPNLRCVELKNGKVRWSEDRFGAGTLSLAGDRLLVLRENGELILASASPDQFKPVARAQILPNGVRAYPALSDGRLYARSKDTLVCVDLRR